MVGQETLMAGQMPAHAHPWLRPWSIDENLFLEPKIMLKWCSDRKPTSPIELPMLLGEGLLTEEDWTPVLR